jgi:16S rRNA processing protein RimM
MTLLARPDRIYLGRFVKAFGIKGELKLLRSSDFWAGALESKRLFVQRLVDGEIERRPVRVERSRPHGKQYVVKLAGVDDRNLAEDEVEGELFVDAEALDVPLPEGELPFLVVGSTVKTEDGRVVGQVTAVLFSSAHPVYEVTGDGREVLIPAVPEFVVGRDDEAGEITIRTIPGLIDE